MKFFKFAAKAFNFFVNGFDFLKNIIIILAFAITVYQKLEEKRTKSNKV